MGGTCLKIRWETAVVLETKAEHISLGDKQISELFEERKKLLRVNIITLLAFFITVKILKFIKGPIKILGNM